MRRHTLLAFALTFCTLPSFAQIVMPATVSGGHADAAVLGGSNSIILGTAVSAAVNNVIIGNGTANANTTGNGNVFIGQGTAGANTTGYANTFLGTWTGGANVGGYANTFLGQYCGIANTGPHNSFVGQGAGNSNTSGGHNTFMGTAAGTGNTTGGGNAALGGSSGFLLGNLTNSTVIGANTKCSVSHAVILGPDGTNGTTKVNVGIGTHSPAAHIHTETNGVENIIFSTTSNANASTVKMQAGANYSHLFLNGNTVAGNYLPAVGSAAAIPQASMSGLVSQTGEAVTIGVDGYETNGSIHFNNMVTDNAGFKNRTECMRIDNSTGFVGVHTRQTGTGSPQAIFHVNLANPVNSGLAPLTQGIRFEGLPSATAAHTQTVVIDANGNLAKGSGGTGTETDPYSWHLLGNTISSGDFIGTLNNLDFVMQTNSNQRARITADGNFDFGTNTYATAVATSGAIGNGNSAATSTSVFSAGKRNDIQGSTFSVAFGESNFIESSTSTQTSGKSNSTNATNYSMALGNSNSIENTTASYNGGTGNVMQGCTQVMMHGDGSTVLNSYASSLLGEDNEMYNAHGCFIGGGHNYMDGPYNFIGGSHSTIIGSGSFIGGDQNYSDATIISYWVMHAVQKSAATTMPTSPTPTTSIMVIGEQVHSDLNKSLSMGFTGNRTSVTTARGMGVQLDPATTSTYIPVVNFEVEAGVSTTGSLPLSGSGVLSNVRFHNLPPDPLGRMLPAVLIDPATGELFQSQNAYLKPGRDSEDSNKELDSLHKENDALKTRVEQLESQLSRFDEKFAQLEKSLSQICESGCEGLKSPESDVLNQSVPNPGDSKVKISYRLARSYSNASISIYGVDGSEVMRYQLVPNKGDGSIDVMLNELQPGVMSTG